MASPPASVGRRRGVGKQLSTEDHALNMIAREAEARLAAKRAARAEARSIRMKELEKAQKEADEQMDRDYELNSEDVSSKKRTIAASRLTSGLIPDDDREVSENISDAQLTQLKDNVRDLDGKYRKAMVSIAQLDNERQALQYQVECLKDQVEDMDESREDLKDELMHKVREYNKLSRDHAETLAELEEMRLVIQHRESLLEEHGINLDGTVKQRDEPDASEPEHGSLHNFVSNHVDSSLVEDAFANEREKLLSEIHTLKEEVALLRASVEPGKEKNANHESLRLRLAGDGTEIERSFVDVSDEADAIREDDRHTGLINNNERNEDFEVIDQGSQHGGVRHFEDASFEKSGLSSLLSSMVLESVFSKDVTGSVESEPLEISVNVSDARSAADHKAADDYDIVNEADSLDTTTVVSTVLDISKLTARPEPERSPSPLPNAFNISKYVAWDVDDPQSPIASFSVDRYLSTTYSSPAVGNDEEGKSECAECNDSAEAVFEMSVDLSAPVEDSILDTPQRASHDEAFMYAHDAGGLNDSLSSSTVFDGTGALIGNNPGVVSSEMSSNLSVDLKGLAPVYALDVVPSCASGASSGSGDEQRVLEATDLQARSNFNSERKYAAPSSEAWVESTRTALSSDSFEAPLGDPAERCYSSLDVGEVKDREADSFERPAEIITDAELDELLDSAGEGDVAGAYSTAFEVGTSAAIQESVADVWKDVERAEIRNHVEALYNEVSTSQEDESEPMSTGATFGVFAITGQKDSRSRGSSSKEAVFVVTGRTGDSSELSDENPKGWLVQVESLHAHGATERPADVKVVEIDSEGKMTVPDLDSVPKVRKKTKTKKSKKVRDSVVSETEDAFHARPHSPGARRGSAREEEYRLALGIDPRTESYSDYSDSEPSDAKTASKKGKKEGCKSQ